jgi:hypothetical protein
MGKKLYAVLMELGYKEEYTVMGLTTDKGDAQERASHVEEWKVAIIGEVLDEGE